DASMLRGVGVSAGGEPPHGGFLRTRGVDLGAVDDVLVTLALGARLDGGEVGAGAGFGVERAPRVFALRDAREVVARLFGGAGLLDRGADPGDALANTTGHPRVRGLVREDRLVHLAGAGAANLFLPRQGEPASLRERAVHVACEF